MKNLDKKEAAAKKLAASQATIRADYDAYMNAPLNSPKQKAAADKIFDAIFSKV